MNRDFNLRAGLIFTLGPKQKFALYTYFPFFLYSATQEKKNGAFAYNCIPFQIQNNPLNWLFTGAKAD